MDEAGGGIGVKGGGRSFLRREAGGDAVALQTAVNGAARQFGVDAAPHRLDDVVERQSEAAPQLDHQGFFPIGQGGAQPMRAGRSIDEVLTALPARHGAAVDAEFARQCGIAGLAFLDIGTSARSGRGIGVQLKIHQPVLPPIGRLPRRDRVVGTLAPVGPQAPPARRAAKLAGVAAPARGSLLWTTGTNCASSRTRRCRRCCRISIA